MALFYRISRIRPEEDGRFRLTIKWYEGAFNSGYVHSNELFVNTLVEDEIDATLKIYTPVAQARIDANQDMVIPNFLQNRLIKAGRERNISVVDTPAPL